MAREGALRCRGHGLDVHCHPQVKVTQLLRLQPTGAGGPKVRFSSYIEIQSNTADIGISRESAGGGGAGVDRGGVSPFESFGNFRIWVVKQKL